MKPLSEWKGNTATWFAIDIIGIVLNIIFLMVIPHEHNLIPFLCIVVFSVAGYGHYKTNHPTKEKA